MQMNLRHDKVLQSLRTEISDTARLHQHALNDISTEQAMQGNIRLIDTATFEIFIKNETEVDGMYAILSHRWVVSELRHDMYCQISALMSSQPVSTSQEHRERLATEFLARNYSNIDSQAFEKVRGGCQVAREHGLRYLWIDTCCINKRSESELNEAIRSMFRWYQRAKFCLTYIVDFCGDLSNLSKCQWFGRGWTLQELLAPTEVLFFDKQWTLLGSRDDLREVISSATNIRLEYLSNFTAAPMATRLSWAAKRAVAKPEDRVYSLFGICGVQFDVRYGVGEATEFLRFQRAILDETEDESIFAWESTPHKEGALLAPSLDSFVKCGGLRKYTAGPRRKLEVKASIRISAPMSLVCSTKSGGGLFSRRRHDPEIDLPLNVMNANGDVVTIRLRRLGESTDTHTCYSFGRIQCNKTGSCTKEVAKRLFDQGGDVEITIGATIQKGHFREVGTGTEETANHRRKTPQRAQRSSYTASLREARPAQMSLAKPVARRHTRGKSTSTVVS